MKSRSLLSFLAIVLLASGAAWVSRASAQVTIPQPPGPIERMVITMPAGGALPAAPKPLETAREVLSGPDIGIRVTGVKNGQVYGTLVVRVDGKWAPVQTLGTETYVGR